MLEKQEQKLMFKKKQKSLKFNRNLNKIDESKSNSNWQAAMLSNPVIRQEIKK
jgi:hypothetical protein